MPLIRELTPDLVITDLKMPFCDGITLTSEIKQQLPRTEVIILTGYDEFDYARQAIRMGVFDFLLKPISPEELQASLVRLQQKRSAWETPYPFEEESALLQAFERADAEKTASELDRFFAQLRSSHPNPDTLHNIVSKLSYELIRTARQKLAVLTIPSPVLPPQADETVLRAALEDYIRQCLHEQESLRSSELVQRIIQYLEQNYAQNITLSSLEEAFFFNASYISRVFKRKTARITAITCWASGWSTPRSCCAAAITPSPTSATPPASATPNISARFSKKRSVCSRYSTARPAKAIERPAIIIRKRGGRRWSIHTCGRPVCFLSEAIIAAEQSLRLRGSPRLFTCRRILIYSSVTYFCRKKGILSAYPIYWGERS